MRVISTSGSRSFKFVPRYDQTANTDYQLFLYNENERTTSSLDAFTYTLLDYNNNNGQVVVTLTDTYTEGDTFSAYINDVTNDRVVYREKIFVTDQTTQNYSINE